MTTVAPTPAQAAVTAWAPVCAARLVPVERAVAALVDGEQVAVVRLLGGELHAVDHRDPVSGAFVMARGIVGSATVDGEQVPTLASPMYKQVFDLRTGACLGDPTVALRTWPVREVDGVVEVGRRPDREV